MKHRVSVMGVAACVACVLAMMLAGCSKAPAGYTPEALEPTVSSPTIGKEGVLRVGVGGGAPFVVSSTGSSQGAGVSGLDVDIAAAIADQLGLKLEIVSLGSDGAVDVSGALAQGDVDIVMGAGAADRSADIWISDPYTQTGVALFAVDGSTVPSRSSAPKIAAQSSSTSAWAVSNAFGDEALVAKGDLLSALSAVETKEVSYVAADAVIGTYAALGQNVDIAPIAVLGAPGGYGVAVASDNTALQKAVSDALSTVSGNGIAAAICSKWLGSPLDLASLPSIELSTSSAPSDAGDHGDGAEHGVAGVERAEGAAPKLDAGANAVAPGSSTGTGVNGAVSTSSADAGVSAAA
ncbi:MAG: transporter substrate-binding domain-containing protein [Slackia sp.]|nr:transporter substrate-binding domain-containing protein [Slackia sp.]